MDPWRSSAAHQRSANCPSGQRLTLAACSRHTEIIDSTQFVERNVRASAQAQHRERLVRASRRAGRCAGVGAVDFLGQGDRPCLCLQRRVGMISVGHPAAKSGPKSLREMIFHVAHLVQWQRWITG